MSHQGLWFLPLIQDSKSIAAPEVPIKIVHTHYETKKVWAAGRAGCWGYCPSILSSRQPHSALLYWEYGLLMVQSFISLLYLNEISSYGVKQLVDNCLMGLGRREAKVQHLL